MSARNPLIVRADICGFSARSSAETVKFSVSCTVGVLFQALEARNNSVGKKVRI